MSNLTKKIVAIVTTLTVSVWMLGPGVAHALTAAELQAQIDALLAQIAELQSQLSEIEGEEVAEVGVIEGVPAGFTFENSLKQGDSGDEVKYLQIVLNSDPETQLAASGVGSAGNETTYFGPLTKAAVIKFQEKYADDVLASWGLTSGTGFVGSTTRAKLNELLSAGVAEEEVTEEEVTEEEVTEEEVVAEGPATIELAVDTPEAAQVALNAQDVIFTKIKFVGGEEGVTITKIIVTRGGVSQDSDLASLKLYDGATQLGSTQALNTLTHQATFSSLNWEIPAGETKYLTMKASIAAKGTATVGDSVKLGIAAASDITADAILEGTFPIYGAAKTIAGISVGQLDVDKQTSPAANNNMLSGSVDQDIAAWKFTADSTEGFDVHKIVVTHVGSATADDVKNIKLMVAGVQIGETVEALDVQNKATFDLSSNPLHINANSSKTIHAYADIASGIWTSRTVIFEITQYTDVVAYGDNSGGAVTITYSSGTAFVKQTGNKMTISQGTLSISADAALNPSGETEYVRGTQSRLISAFKFSTGATEGVRVTKLSLYMDGSGGATDISNVTLWDGSVQIAGPGQVIGSYVTFGANTVGWDENGLFDVEKSSTKTILVKADIPLGASTGADIISLDINASSDVLADGLTSKYDVPASKITGTAEGNALDIAAKGTLSASLAAGTPASQTYVIGGNTEGKEFLRFNLTAGSGEDILVTAFTFDLFSNRKAATSGAHLVNVKVVNVDTGEQFGSTVASPTSEANFSGSLTVPASETVTLKVLGEIPTSDYPNPNGSIALASTTAIATAIDSTGVSSGAAIVETGSAIGNTMTIGAGDLTITVAATPADQEKIKGAVEVPLVGLILTAGTAEDVRVSYLKLWVSAETAEASTTDLGNIALYDGTTRLTAKKNLTGAASGIHHYVEFVASDFLNSTGIDINKGQQKTLTVKADILSTAAAGHKLALGVSTTDDVVTTGLSSNTSVTETLTAGPGSATGVNYHYTAGTADDDLYAVTLAGAGTLTVSNNPGTPVTDIIAVGGEGVGKSGVVMHQVDFEAVKESMYIKSISLSRSGGSDADFGDITLWDGSNPLGSAQSLSNGSSTWNFPEGSYWEIPAGGPKTLTIKADLNGIAGPYGYGASTGDAPKLGVDTIDPQGVSSGNDDISVNGASAADTAVVDLFGNPQYLRQSAPTLASASLPSTVFGAGEKTLYRWTITADSQGAIGWEQMTFSLSGNVTYGGSSHTVGCVVDENGCADQTDGVYMSTSTEVGGVPLIATSSMKIYDVATNEEVIATTTATGWTVSQANGLAKIKFVAASEQVIAAGKTKTYELRGTILTGGATGDALMSKLAALSSSLVSGDTYANVAGIGVSLTWTDRSGAGGTHSAGSQDWTNDYKVDGIPTATLTLSK
jgi:hypothetical protein